MRGREATILPLRWLLETVATGLATDLNAHLIGNDADFSYAPIDPIFGNRAGVRGRPFRRQNFDGGLLPDGQAMKPEAVRGTAKWSTKVKPVAPSTTTHYALGAKS